MSLLKPLYYAALIIFCTTCLFACAALKQQPPQANTYTVYYSDYLGLSISVPLNWQINDISANLSEQPGQTTVPQLLAYAEGSSRLELIDMQTGPGSGDTEHSRFCAYAELLSPDIDLAQYTELLLNLLETDNGNYTYTVEKQEQLSLARNNAQRICLTVQGSEGQQYTEEYYIVDLNKAFAVFYLNYWPQNPASQQAAFSVLENISLPPPP